MAHAAALACCCASSLSGHFYQQSSFNGKEFGISHLPIGKHIKRPRQLDAVAVLPLYSLAAEAAAQINIPEWTITTYHNTETLDETTIKNIYLIFGFFFVWGCCVYGSMNDPLYDSDLYRGEGGDGSGNWMYTLEEEEEKKAREELWREELAREIEARVGELKELEEAQKEKEEEFV